MGHDGPVMSPDVGPPDRMAFLRAATERGFSRVAFGPVSPSDRVRLIETWLADGHHASMSWMERHVELRLDPRRLVPEARTLISLWMDYPSESNLDPVTSGPDAPKGRFARYALGEDYHQVIRQKLRDLARWSGDPLARACVDTAPVLERAAAEQAGLGWIGKNGCLIVPGRGSYGFLAELFTSFAYAIDPGPHPDRCGTCTRCHVACPTGAFVSPGVIDSRRCIAYWTIEHRGEIPEAVRPWLGDWVFGCDLCQEACPWNRFAPGASEPRLQARPGASRVDLEDLLFLDDAGFERRYGDTAVRRTRRQGLSRNAAIALGNVGDERSLPALERAMVVESDEIVREACDWAMRRIRQRHEPSRRG